MSARILGFRRAAGNGLVDERLIGSLRLLLDDAVCREFLHDVMFAATDGLVQLEIALTALDREAIGRIAGAIAGISGEAGMIRLSAVGRDLRDCAPVGHWPTIHAVGQRLLRIGEETLTVYPASIP